MGETTEQKRKRLSLTETELLIYCIWSWSEDADYPKTANGKPTQDKIMELFNRKGSTQTFKEWADKTSGNLVSSLALQMIKILMKGAKYDQ